MSTKIYYAYRMPVNVFTPVFLPAFRKHVIGTAANFVKMLMPNVTPSELKAVFKEKKEYDKKLTYKKFAEDENSFILRIIFQKMAEASKSRQRSLECIDCSLNIWIYDGRVYTILYGESWLWKKFKLPDGVEDYPYWNNTDEPDGVTRRQWTARGKTWDKVCLDSDWNATRMVHEVINASQETGLFEVAERIVGNKKAFIATWLH